MQAQILYKILYQCRMSSRTHGFTIGRSTATCAEYHTNQPIIAEIDLENFFPNIVKDQIVIALMEDKIGREAAEFIADICLYNNELPQGAVTSPSLSNVVSRREDYRLNGFGRRHKLEYSRYADNIFYSGGQTVVDKLGVIFAIISDCGFYLAMPACPGSVLLFFRRD